MVTEPGGSTLRLVWPQWQGASRDMVAQLMPGVPLEQATRGYATGTAVLNAVLPPHDGPTATVPVAFDADGLELRDGVEAKSVVAADVVGLTIAEFIPRQDLALQRMAAGFPLL
ncbi:hypothetical protein BH10ACT9_BH10ACT9_60530 [soil metagenome]